MQFSGVFVKASEEFVAVDSFLQFFQLLFQVRAATVGPSLEFIFHVRHECYEALQGLVRAFGAHALLFHDARCILVRRLNIGIHRVNHALV